MQTRKFGQVIIIIIIIIIYYYTKHDVQTLKFGQVIDLDAIERVGVIQIWSSPDETLIIAS